MSIFHPELPLPCGNPDSLCTVFSSFVVYFIVLLDHIVHSFLRKNLSEVVLSPLSGSVFILSFSHLVNTLVGCTLKIICL